MSALTTSNISAYLKKTAASAALNTVYDLKFREINRFGFIREYTVKYLFTDNKPGLGIMAADMHKNLEPAGGNPPAAATRANTITGAFQPAFKVQYSCITGAQQNVNKYLLPYASQPAFVLKRREGAGWQNLAGMPAAGNFSSIDGNVTYYSNLATANGIHNTLVSNALNTKLAACCCFTASSMNIIGNTSSAAFAFYFDDGVEAAPQIVWTYNLPYRQLPEGTAQPPGKNAAHEIDFDTLAAGTHPLIQLNSYDKFDWPAAEGFRGTPAFAAGNEAQVRIPVIPGVNIAASTSVPLSTAPNAGYFYFALSPDAVLQHNNLQMQTAPYVVEEIVNGEYRMREIRMPVNIWDLPFNVQVECTDWIGNTATVQPAAGPGLAYAYSGTVYTPAFCPDISIITVNAESADPQPGSTLGVALLPAFRECSANFSLEVRDAAGNLVFPANGSSNTYSTTGNAIHIEPLFYGSEYWFHVSAQNRNLYTTEPSNSFRYILAREHLVIGRRGALTENEVWNWRYRLLGDVEIPAGYRLDIIPGGEVTMPRLPGVHADRRAKILVRTDGTLVIDGSLGDPGAESFDPRLNAFSKDGFINLVPSGLDARLDGGGGLETIYQFEGENNWGGIYFEAGYNSASHIRRARIAGAYDGIVVFGGDGTGSSLLIEDSFLAANYTGIHITGNGRLDIRNSVLNGNLEYGIKTEGGDYAVNLIGVNTAGSKNRYADYYSARLQRRLGFGESAGEGGNE